ncbi:MAG TPA: hypothetical protein VEV81_06720, partial [Pyrinomonadaceae bacterium]|nr:hypothetical protein [Pyrinomonadaceae bacterium]
YMKYLYKYPQAEFPYSELVNENRRRGKLASEYELIDTGVFDEDRYFDVFVEYAKAEAEDILIRIHVTNRGPQHAHLYLLPTIWFRNRWSWGYGNPRPSMRRKMSVVDEVTDDAAIEIDHFYYGKRYLYCEGAPALLFTENETNNQRLFGVANQSPYVKDGINNYLVRGQRDAVNPEQEGTKAAALYRLNLNSGGSATVRLRFTNNEETSGGAQVFGADFDQVFAERQTEADEFYASVIPQDLSPDAQNVMRQSFAGLLWSKQYYHYVVEEWLKGDPACPPPPAERWHGRNHDWRQLYNADVISMPDKWEYPWYAAWDLAFHCVPLSLIDADFAKDQLILMLREWYMHPNGQIPAYEWALNDVNPPVHAWAAWRVYRIEAKRKGTGDRNFLERVFHKLMLNFTWWVNRKDTEGNNIFEGGFLGLDNIGVFDRNTQLPDGSFIEQSDGTSWMAMYTLNLLAIALELAREDQAYEDVASKFWEHFIFIAHAMNNIGRDNVDLWNEEDGFYYDVLHTPDGQHTPMRVHSVVGLIPLFAVEPLEPEMLDHLPG